MKHLGIDYGKKNIGIALSDERGEFAFPEKVLSNMQSMSTMAQQIVQIGKEKGVSTVVVGESKNFKGKDNKIMSHVKEFVSELRQQGLDVVYEPEIMSTIQAERIQGNRSDIDASAAAVILQSYLDRQKFKHQPPSAHVDKYTIIQDDSVDAERTMDDFDEEGSDEKDE